jgi:hypothetical protein
MLVKLVGANLATMKNGDLEMFLASKSNSGIKRACLSFQRLQS